MGFTVQDMLDMKLFQKANLLWGKVVLARKSVVLRLLNLQILFVLSVVERSF
mgnify:CR=1 FL=1